MARRPAASVLLALALVACGDEDIEVGPGGELLAGTHRASDVETRGVILGGRRLVLDGFAGTVRVSAGRPGDPAQLEFERVARGQNDLAAQRLLAGVRVEETGGRAEYTYRMEAYSREGAEVNVRAVVPRDASLRVTLASGAVEVDSLEGDLEVVLRAGPVRAAALAGRRVRLATGAGSVAAGARVLPSGADWDLEAETGSVEVTLPAASSARLRAEAATGTVRVEGLDFRRRRLDRRATGMRFSGTLGEGDGEVDAGTGVGTVRLRAASDPPVRPGGGL